MPVHHAGRHRPPRKLTVFGDDYDTPDGTGVRDYIHVVDLAEGHLCAIRYAQAHTGCEVFNLGTGRGVSVLEMVHTFSEVNNVPVPYVIGPRRAGDLARSTQTPPRQSRSWLGGKEKRLPICAATAGAGRPGTRPDIKPGAFEKHIEPCTGTPVFRFRQKTVAF